MKLKKILAGITTFALAITAAATPFGDMLPLPTVTQQASAEAYGDYEYTVLSDGTAEIIGYNGKDTELEIPSEIDGKKVTSIGGKAFYHCSSLTSIIIPNSVTSIGDGAFYGCSCLESVTIPDSVTSIEDGTFYGCSCLTSITIPSSATSIGVGAFSYCYLLTNFTIPDSVTSIGNSAFSKCVSLTSVTIPDSVKSIGNFTFSGCSSLTSVAIGNSVTSIEDGAFFECSSLESITIGNSVTSIGNNAFYDCESLESITIPNSVTSIEGYVFKSCISLTSITIPDSVTDIGNYAFVHCSGLESITIGNSVTSIGGYAFYDCSSLTDVYYTGTEAQWSKINIGDCNSALLNANIHYNYNPAPSAVTGLKLAGRASDALRISWTKDTSADGYIVEMYKGSKWTQAAKITKNTTVEYRQAGLSAGTVYKFRVKAYKGTAQGDYSAELSARTSPSNVTGLKLAGRASNALRISWTKNTSADGYIVEMYKGGKWVRAAKITSNSTTEFKKTGLAAGTAYKFRVRAYKMSGKTALYSGYTNISARTNPSNVTGMKTLGRARTAVRFGWTKNTSADGYIVEMYKDGKWVRAAKITSNATVQFKKSGLKSGTTYKFRVKAYKMSGKTALYSGYTNYNIATTK